MAAKAGQLCSFRRSSGQQHQTGSTNPSNAFSLFTSTTSNGGKICTSLYLRRCLPEKFYAKQMVLKNVIRTYWGMQKKQSANSYYVPPRRQQLAQTAPSAQLRRVFWPVLHQSSLGAHDMILHFAFLHTPIGPNNIFYYHLLSTKLFW